MFAYCAGKLAAGIIDFEGVGPAYPVSEVIVHDKLFNPDVQPNCVEGIITQAIRQFGNLNTNIPVESFNAAGFKFGDMVHITITHNDHAHFDADVLYEKSFGYVGCNEPIVYNGSMLYIGIALNQGHFANTYSIADGESWKVRITK